MGWGHGGRPRAGSRDIEQLGSAHDEEELEALKAAAKQRIAEGQGDLDLGMNAAASSGPLEIVGSRTGHLWEALCRGYDAAGFAVAADGDVVFRDLVLARIIEPTSKLDSLRVLAEAGIEPTSYATLKRRLPVYAKDSRRQGLAAACARHAAWGRRRWCSTTCPCAEQARTNLSQLGSSDHGPDQRLHIVTADQAHDRLGHEAIVRPRLLAFGIGPFGCASESRASGVVPHVHNGTGPDRCHGASSAVEDNADPL